MRINNELEKNIVKQIVETYKNNLEEYKQNENFVLYGTSLDWIMYKHIQQKFSFCIDPQRNNVLSIVIKEMQYRKDHLQLPGKYASKYIRQCEYIQLQILHITQYIRQLEENRLIFVLKDPAIEDNKNFIFEPDYHPFEIFHKELNQYVFDNLFSFIIPSLELIQIVENNFKTIEEIQYEEQLNISKKALNVANKANYIALGIGIVSIILSLFYNFID